MNANGSDECNVSPWVTPTSEGSPGNTKVSTYNNTGLQFSYNEWMIIDI